MLSQADREVVGLNCVGLRSAGIDLIRSLCQAPHGREVFERPGAKRIGRLLASD